MLVAMEFDLFILNGVVVLENEVGEFDIAIKDEKIAKVVPRGGLEGMVTKKTIDAQNGLVVLILMCISIDYSFHALCTSAGPLAISEFPALRAAGISSLKFFMAFEDLQLHDDEILDVLLAARRNQMTLLVHAENGQVISWMTKQLEKEGLFDPKWHISSHPPVAETEAASRAIALAGFIDVPILIVHVSQPAVAETIRAAKKLGLPIFAETCPQYLFLTRDDLDKPGFEGAKCVCSPPPRNASDHEGIWRGLEDGTLTVFSSDHCPFVYEDENGGKKSSISKEYPNGRFQYIPNGCPGVETRLALAFSAKRLKLQKFVEVSATYAAKMYGLYPQKGALIPGKSDADVTIWYPEDESFTLSNKMLHHNVDYTPYEGQTLNQWPRYTILRGKVVWDRDAGGVVGNKGYGKFLERGALVPNTLNLLTPPSG
ncbi:putative Dihydropyrimidinase [Glarea lozoyensis 74030]|uniref:Putative Dihydropyrimidinase n=1 Tax=Glarea lozoyensis (strain ATCC 74030 / MF5533) TaxID=1104152 RepID=H0EU27_GLAL7|nr:putative Dihydropyrimidinase [Glarea lozoyensis 74030]